MGEYERRLSDFTGHCQRNDREFVTEIVSGAVDILDVEGQDDLLDISKQYHEKNADDCGKEHVEDEVSDAVGSFDLNSATDAPHVCELDLDANVDDAGDPVGLQSDMLWVSDISELDSDSCTEYESSFVESDSEYMSEDDDWQPSSKRAKRED